MDVRNRRENDDARRRQCVWSFLRNRHAALLTLLKFSLVVTRCVCFNQSFESLKAIMKAKNLSTFEELKTEVVFGEKCKMCVPYVRKMIETGKTAFPYVPNVQEIKSLLKA
ncbi:MAG: (2Fe-2S)-binding protein [Chloroherpetonaceae bacterium]|nr:(2Fe-2S)-binding protein [Chloroherpetonaceae bacterium]MDW8438054.1 (2Fe-2S)-binding protein [Chloroherpetonaceae bacterium]